jgi:squalene-hopene/tetraprenyl-beta-curcumene cyclase
VTLLCRVRREQDKPILDRALRYLRERARRRWFMVRPLGHQSHLRHLVGAHGVGAGATSPHDDPCVRRAVDWLVSVQNPDGGWGENNDGYALGKFVTMASTPYQTAWAMLGLLAAGEAKSQAVQRAAEYLMRTADPDGLWSHPSFTAPGFPRVFYLKYHGYCAYFPLWALAAYRTLTRRGTLIETVGVVAALAPRRARWDGPSNTEARVRASLR